MRAYYFESGLEGVVHNVEQNTHLSPSIFLLITPYKTSLHRRCHPFALPQSALWAFHFSKCSLVFYETLPHKRRPPFALPKNVECFTKLEGNPN